MQITKQDIENTLLEVLPKENFKIFEYKVFNKYFGISIYASSKEINNVRGQYVQHVSLSLSKDKNELKTQMFNSGGNSIYRIPNKDIPSEKYLAMKRVKIPFRKPKNEKKNILNGIKKFAQNYIKVLKKNEDNLMYKNLTDYSFLK